MPMWGGPGRKELVEACMLCEHRETQERKVLERKVGACVQTQEDWGRRVQGVGCVCVCVQASQEGRKDVVHAREETQVEGTLPK